MISQSNPIYIAQLISGESSQRYHYANLFLLYIIKDPSRSFWTLLEMEPTRICSHIQAIIKNIPTVLCYAKIVQSRTFRKLLETSPVLCSNCKNVHGHSFPFLSPKRSKQLVYVNTNLQKILNGANSFRSKFKILKVPNSFGEQIPSLKDKKTAILNSQNIKMLKIHVSNDIYNKYCLIHITSPLQGKERFMT